MDVVKGPPDLAGVSVERHRARMRAGSGREAFPHEIFRKDIHHDYSGSGVVARILKADAVIEWGVGGHFAERPRSEGVSENVVGIICAEKGIDQGDG